jgi:hypothetical protein
MSGPRLLMRILVFVYTVAAAAILVFAQSGAGVHGLGSVTEFPVNMQQNVIAGRTPQGTKVEAKLTIATLVGGAVIPDGAIFVGEVVESLAKSGADPSRLAIRMDSVQWKKGSTQIKVFLTAWYYPLKVAVRDDECLTASRMSAGCANGIGRSNSPDIGTPPPVGVSDKRVVMKDMQSVRRDDGTVVLSSSRFNIKLDKTTTYVLATSDLAASR